MSKSHWDRFGLLQESLGEPATTGNFGALITTEYFFFLDDPTKRMIVPAIKIALRNLEVQTTYGCITTKYPNAIGCDSIENMIALIMFSELFDNSRLSKKLYAHCELTRANRIDATEFPEENMRKYPLAWVLSGFKSPNRFFNSRQFEWSYKSWQGKNLGFIALLELSAIDRLKWWKYPLIGYYLFSSLFTKDSNKVRANHLAWQWLKTRDKTWGLLYKIWTVILTKKHKGGLKAIYESEYGPDHPLTKLAKEYLK